MKKLNSNKLMDEDSINGLIQRCQKLKHKVRGVFSADSFLSKMKSNNFLIVNASKSQSPGRHWHLICRKNNHLVFFDPLRRSLSSYKNIYQQFAKNYVQFHRLFEINKFKVKTQNRADSFVIFCPFNF